MQKSNISGRKARLAGLLAAVCLSYCALSSVWHGMRYHGWFSEKMKSSADAARMIQKVSADLEHKKPGITIDYFFGEDDFRCAFATKTEENHYLIMFDEGRNMLATRHECYHVYDGDCDRKKEENTYWVRKKDEFECWTYALTGIEL